MCVPAGRPWLAVHRLLPPVPISASTFCQATTVVAPVANITMTQVYMHCTVRQPHAYMRVICRHSPLQWAFLKHPNTITHRSPLQCQRQGAHL